MTGSALAPYACGVVSSQSKPSIYVLGIAGTGTGALAGLLQSAGHAVRGVDSVAYPPMREKLAEWGIEVLLGYDAAHLVPPPDLVIVGNVIRRANVEATYVREHALPAMSMPQAIAEFAIGQRHSVVVAGTHGKTTTTALIAHLFVQAGRDPGFLVGGALVGQRDSFRLGSGPFVIEGDEYDTAYFDKGAKFLHYRARTLVVTSLEYDHADIYDSVEAIEAAFAKLFAGMPEGGHVVVWRGAHRALRLLRERGGHLDVTVYDAAVVGEAIALPASAPTNASLLAASGVVVGPAGTTLHARFTPAPAQAGARQRSATERVVGARGAAGERTSEPGEAARPRGAVSDVAAAVALWGEFGAQNALAAIAVARAHGIGDADIVRALSNFAGVHRRLEERGEQAGRLIVDDFAHHPTAVDATLRAARQRYPARRLWAVFEPRSATSRRNLFFAEYQRAFALADVAVIANHARLAEVDAAQRFDPQALARALAAAGTQAHACDDTDAIVRCVHAGSRAGDVIVLLSNGDFDGLLPRLLALRWPGEESGP